MKGYPLGSWEGVPEPCCGRLPLSILSQRLAYGITPENEHHLVAQRDVRQFQVGAAWTIPVGAGGWGAGAGVHPL